MYSKINGAENVNTVFCCNLFTVSYWQTASNVTLDSTGNY